MKLHLYVARELLEGLTMAVGGMFFIAIPGMAVSAVHKLAGVDMTVLLKYLPIVAGGLVPYILPIGYLLAVVATFGRMASDNEWTAMRMAGIHPLKVMVAPALLALVLGGFTYWLVADSLPKQKRQQKEYLAAAVEYVLRNLSPGRTEIEFDPFYLSSRYRDGDAFIDAFIHIPSEQGPAKVLRADRVVIDFIPDPEAPVLPVGAPELDPNRPSGDVMRIRLSNARTFIEGTAARSEEATFFVRLAELAQDEQSQRRRAKYLTSTELHEELAAGRVPPDKEHGFLYEIQYRRTFGATFILFLLLGAPTGLILRRGTQLGALAVSVGFAVVYYVLALRLGKALGTEGVLPPFVGAWVTTGIGLVLGGLLMRKALSE